MPSPSSAARSSWSASSISTWKPRAGAPRNITIPRRCSGPTTREVIAATKPDIVFNCTTPEAHTPVTLAAFEHGCHVLSEKPLADSMENARTLVEAGRRAGRVFAVMQNRRFQHSIRRLRRLAGSGTLGEMTTLNCDFYLCPHFGGFREQMDHVLMLDMAIHTFDQARLITGADPVAVTCHEWNPPGSWYRHGASAVAIFEMTGGLVFTYRGSWCANGLATSWEADWRAIGTQGSAKWDGGDGFKVEVVDRLELPYTYFKEGAVPPAEPGDPTDFAKGLILDFIACLREGRTPETLAEDNIKSLAMVFGAIESAPNRPPRPHSNLKPYCITFGRNIPMSDPLKSIRIGTILLATEAAAIIPKIKPYGFESLELIFDAQHEHIDYAGLAEGIKRAIGDDDIVISALDLYANPLMEETPHDIRARQIWGEMIDNAHVFGAPVVAGFAGRVRNKPVPDSIPKFKEVFGPLADRAEDKGLRIAIENCEMGGTWATGDCNFAHTPAAWELMFDAVDSPALGLEWEPCHQMVKLIDPMPQLREWIHKIPSCAWQGRDGPCGMSCASTGSAARTRLRSTARRAFGDSNWTDIISELKRGGFTGAIDIEGYHDPVYRGELEWTGQVHALNYLKSCRGGQFVPNP